MSSVSFEVDRPPAFQRVHVFLRIALLIVIGWLGHPWGLLWLGFPVVAAILVAQKGDSVIWTRTVRPSLVSSTGSSTSWRTWRF
jgi:hypothetical protein